MREAFLRDLQAGLARRPRALSPKWFYDAEGSRLFEAITRLPEYYLTRQETALLASAAPELAADIPAGAVLVEPGSGASEKTRLLLDAAKQLHAYAPIDISPSALETAAEALRRDYPNLQITPLAADFSAGFRLPKALEGRPRVGFFPGSTLGNFDTDEAVALLRNLRETLGEGGQLILGVDLNRDPGSLLPAYDDAQGVTGRFNLNLLARANRELGADFDLQGFAHRAVWNPAAGRVEMHLVSLRAQTVTVGGRAYVFTEGEALRSEISRKFTEAEINDLAAASGWRRERAWRSPPPTLGLFLLAAG